MNDHDRARAPKPTPDTEPKERARPDAPQTQGSPEGESPLRPLPGSATQGGPKEGNNAGGDPTNAVTGDEPQPTTPEGATGMRP